MSIFQFDGTARKQPTYLDFLDQVLCEEIGSKQRKRVAMGIQIAHFPAVRTLEEFDFCFQPSIDQKLVRELATARYVTQTENVLLFGPPGVGKTHLAIALGRAAVEAGHSVLFTSATALLAGLAKAESEGQLADKAAFYAKPRLLVIDELGYLPFEKRSAHLFFQLVARRYERGSMLITTNQLIGQWGTVFGDDVGRECINPRPLGYAKIFYEGQPHAESFITYSEGCNDDFNKVLWSCLGWNPEMRVEQVVREYSRYLVSARYEEPFSRGLLALEQNWAGPLLLNTGVEKTLRLFQDMERGATPQEKLNWRFQQGLYRAYYDAYIRARLIYETGLEKHALAVLAAAREGESLSALNQAEGILNQAGPGKPSPELRSRVHELAEALYPFDNRGNAGEPEWLKKERGCGPDQAKGQLFNLRDDPAQKHNLYAAHSERVRELQALLDHYRREGRSTPGPAQENDAPLASAAKPNNQKRQ